MQVSRVKFQPPGSNSSHMSQIPALRFISLTLGSNNNPRLRSWPRGPNPCLKSQPPALRPQSPPDVSLVVQIETQRPTDHSLGFSISQSIPFCPTNNAPSPPRRCKVLRFPDDISVVNRRFNESTDIMQDRLTNHSIYVPTNKVASPPSKSFDKPGFFC